MIEIRFHGRGGQGAMTAAAILAEATFAEGQWSQKIPVYGSEQRGAPVVAYLRIDEQPIRQNYLIYEPDWIVVLDERLRGVVNVTAGLKGRGVAILNDRTAPEDVDLGVTLSRVATVDATAISTSLFGQRAIPITNTTMLGALSSATGVVKLESLFESIEESFPSSIAEKNIEAATLGYEQVRVRSVEEGDGP